MRALLLIVLLFVQQGWGAEVKPPTDWQLLNLNGKVKKCTIKTVTSVVVKSGMQMDIVFYEEYVFGRDGYLLSKKKYKMGDGKRKYRIYIDDIVYGKYADQTRKLTVYGASTAIVNQGEQVWTSATSYNSTDKMDTKSGTLMTTIGTCDDKGRLIREERIYSDTDQQAEKYSFVTKIDYNSKGEKESYDIVDGLKKKEDSYYIDIATKDRVGNPLKVTATDDSDRVYSTATITYEYHK
ncbi:MAG: hypothetical protein LBI73_00475 [Myroides sp.]|jgi:hypothetical protein|nr:hypothetical protein [Myroides sp.]